MTTKLFCSEHSKCCFSLRDWGLLVFRLVLGGFMLTHGFGKLAKFAELSEVFQPVFGSSQLGLILILFAEIGCSIAIMLGLFTRLATIPLIIGMIVAVLTVHAGHTFQQMELPLLYLGMYVTLLLTGPGKVAVDALIYKRFCPNSGKGVK